MKANEEYTILIIDDNPMNLLVASKTIENFGFKTICAESGAAALDLLENHFPALILLDVMMPEMDGYEVCRKIKSTDKIKDIPVVFLTASNQTDDMVEGFAAGGVDYITKPFKAEELRVRIKNHIDLSESRKTIVEMMKSRDKLYSIIAHDVRSPLSGILQTVDAIDQGFFNPGSEDFKEIIHHLKNRTQETNTLLTSLLEWTRLNADNITMNFQLVHLNDVITSCVSLLEPNAKNKSIEICTNVTSELYAWCDEVSVHTIFRNLLSNAIKFTKISGKINIEGYEFGNTARISVSDNGVGMSSETVQKIFEDNKHFTSSGTANEQGTGLGLMLVKDFIFRNNGSIKVESKENEGTTITVELPTTN